MSLLLRPAGDAVAKSYGDAYLTPKQLLKIKVGDKFEVLCNDNKHYRVEVKEFNAVAVEGTLHFCFWKTRFDYQGSFKAIYLSPDGLYSEGKLSAQNTYLVSLPSKPAKRVKPAASSEFAEKTRYPEDFLTKPRLFSGRRRVREEVYTAEDNKSSSPDYPVRDHGSESLRQKMQRTDENKEGGGSHFLLQRYNFDDDAEDRKNNSNKHSNSASTLLHRPLSLSHNKSALLDVNGAVDIVGSTTCSGAGSYRSTTVDIPSSPNNDGLSSVPFKADTTVVTGIAVTVDCDNDGGEIGVCQQQRGAARKASSIDEIVVEKGENAKSLQDGKGLSAAVVGVPVAETGLKSSSAVMVGSEALRQMSCIQAELPKSILQAQTLRLQLQQYTMELQHANCSLETESSINVHCSRIRNIGHLLGARIHVDTMMLALMSATINCLPLDGDNMKIDCSSEISSFPKSGVNCGVELDHSTDIGLEHVPLPDESDHSDSSSPPTQTTNSLSTWTSWALGHLAMKKSE